MSDLLKIFATSQIQMIVVLIAVDVVLGILAALAKKNFVLGKLAGFMVKPVLGYVLGFVVLVMVGKALPGLAIVATIAYFLIILSLIGSILDNLGKLGLPMPKILRK